MKLSKKGELLTVVIVVVVVVAIALATAVAVMVAGASDARNVGLEQSEAINAKLRYDRTKELIDDAVWLGTREAYLEESGDPEYENIEDKIKDYLNTLNGTEMSQMGGTPDYYPGINILGLEVNSYQEPVYVDFPVNVNAWGQQTDRGLGWGDCESMTGSWDDVDQFCQCKGYEGAAPVSENPCYQQGDVGDRRRWEPDDDAGNCIDYWDDGDDSGDAMTQVKCGAQVYDVSYRVDLSGNMQIPRISLTDQYSSAKIVGPVILTVHSTTGGKVDLPQRYGDQEFEGDFLFERGEDVLLRAYPNDGWYFDYWSGDVPKGKEQSHTIEIHLNRDKNVKAHFDWYRELTVDSTSGGHVDVNPEREDGYKAGAKVTLTAKPSTGYEFVKWTGDVPEGNEEEREITIIMDNNRDLKAHFEQYCDPDQCPGDGDCKDPGDTWGSHNRYCCTDEVDVSECSGILVCSSDGDGDCPDKSCVRWENWSRCGWGTGITR